MHNKVLLWLDVKQWNQNSPSIVLAPESLKSPIQSFICNTEAVFKQSHISNPAAASSIDKKRCVMWWRREIYAPSIVMTSLFIAP